MSLDHANELLRDSAYMLGVPVVDGVEDLLRKVLVGGDADHDVPCVLQPPEQAALQLPLPSARKAGQRI